MYYLPRLTTQDGHLPDEEAYENLGQILCRLAPIRSDFAAETVGPVVQALSTCYQSSMLHDHPEALQLSRPRGFRYTLLAGHLLPPSLHGHGRLPLAYNVLWRLKTQTGQANALWANYASCSTYS